MDDDIRNPETDSPDTPDTDGPTAQAVRDEIVAAADTIDVGDATTMLATVHSTVGRRRRRRNAIVGVAAAGVLIASGVVVANLVGGDDGDDLIVSAPATEAPTTEPDVDDGEEAPSVTSVDDTGEVHGSDGVEVTAGDSVPVRVVPASAEDIVDSGLTVEAANVGQTHLLAWQDGFLSIRTTFEPQPLPAELPPEIAEQFPPEVVDLFPDGLPPTIDEAIQVLQEADLLDEVSQVLADNQDIYDAVYAEEAVVDTTVRFSTDGREWSDITADFPVADNYWSHVSTTTDRMVIGVESYDDEPGTPGSPRAIDVYSSTDLVEWELQQIPLASPPANDEYGSQFSTYLSGFAATDTGFIASTGSSFSADPFELLPPDVRDQVENSGYNSIGWGDDGITVEIFDDTAEIPDNGESNPEPIEVLTFTWEELGLEGPPDEDGRDSRATYVSTWGGQPTEVESSGPGWFIGVGDHFVELGPEPRRSTNGIDWTPIAAPDDGLVNGIVETSRGAALLVGDELGRSTIYEGDLEAGDWSLIEVPGLPDNVGGQSWGRSVFLFQDFGESDTFGPDPSLDAVGTIQRAEVDGYRYELVVTHTADEYGASYTVTDIESGEVVVTESADGLSDEDDSFEFVQDGFGSDQLRILDPATGDVVVDIPFDAMTQELINADGTTVDVTEPRAADAVPDTEFAEPNHWVLANLDAGWVVEELGRIQGGEGRWPMGAVVVDDIALVAWSDGTFTRITPS